MSDELKNVLLQSNKITDSEKWDAEYDSLPVVIAESTSTLDGALSVSYTHLTLPTKA